MQVVSAFLVVLDFLKVLRHEFWESERVSAIGGTSGHHLLERGFTREGSTSVRPASGSHAILLTKSNFQIIFTERGAAISQAMSERWVKSLLSFVTIMFSFAVQISFSLACCVFGRTWGV